MKFIFPYIGNNHHPNWQTPSFFRGVGIPPTSISYCCLQASYYRTSIRSNENPDPVVTISGESNCAKAQRVVSLKCGGKSRAAIVAKFSSPSLMICLAVNLPFDIYIYIFWWFIPPINMAKPPISGWGIFQGVTPWHRREFFEESRWPSALVIPGDPVHREKFWSQGPPKVTHQKTPCPDNSWIHKIHIHSYCTVSLISACQLAYPELFLRRQWFCAVPFLCADEVTAMQKNPKLGCAT